MNLKGESSRLREIDSRIRQLHSQLREEFSIQPGLQKQSIDNMCGVVDDLDAITREMKSELKQQRYAVADINDAACSTLGTLLTARRKMLAEQGDCGP